jgi:hypothetical protein
MEKDKYANLTTEQLLKRKKIASILLVILAAATVLDGSAIIYDLVNDEGFNTTLFVPAVACAMLFLIMYMGKKKLQEVLKSRDI